MNNLITLLIFLLLVSSNSVAMTLDYVEKDLNIHTVQNNTLKTYKKRAVFFSSVTHHNKKLIVEISKLGGFNSDITGVEIQRSSEGFNTDSTMIEFGTDQLQWETILQDNKTLNIIFSGEETLLEMIENQILNNSTLTPFFSNKIIIKRIIKLSSKIDAKGIKAYKSLLTKNKCITSREKLSICRNTARIPYINVTCEMGLTTKTVLALAKYIAPIDIKDTANVITESACLKRVQNQKLIPYQVKHILSTLQKTDQMPTELTLPVIYGEKYEIIF